MRYWLLFSLLPTSLFGQIYPNNSELNLEEIMKGNDFIGHQPGSPSWSDDGSKIYFDWNPDGEIGDQLYAYDIKTKSIELVSPAEFVRYPSRPDESTEGEFLYRNGNDLLLYDGDDSELIWRGTNRVHNIHYGEKYSYFEMDKVLYRYPVGKGGIQAVFQAKKGSKPSESEPNHWQQEEEDLFLFIQEQKEKEAWNEEQSDRWKEDIPTAYYGSKSVSNIQMSYNEQFVLYRVNDYPNNPNTEVFHHVVEDGKFQFHV